jgi:hypothetical protein
MSYAQIRSQSKWPLNHCHPVQCVVWIDIKTLKSKRLLYPLERGFPYKPPPPTVKSGQPFPWLAFRHSKLWYDRANPKAEKTDDRKE